MRNFEAISLVASVLGPENHLESWVSKAVLMKNILSTAKNISQGYYYVLRYPFIPTNPLLAMMFFFFLFFAFLILCALFLLNHNTSKSKFCVKLFSCKRNFVSQNFLGPLFQNVGPLKLIFLIAQARTIVFL